MGGMKHEALAKNCANGCHQDMPDSPRKEGKRN